MRPRAHVRIYFCDFIKIKLYFGGCMKKNTLNKFFFALAIVFCMCSGFVLCGCDNGKNMKVSVDKSVVSIYLGETQDDTATVIASVTDNGSASDEVYFSFENERASLVKSEYVGNGKTKAYIKGNIPGTTQVRVHTKEKNKICEFQVEVVQPLTGLSAKTDNKNYLIKGQKTKILASNFVEFQPINTSQINVEIVLATEVSEDLAFIEKTEDGIFVSIAKEYDQETLSIKLSSLDRPNITPVIVDFEVLNPILYKENDVITGISKISATKSVNQVLYSPMSAESENLIYLAHNDNVYSEEVVTLEVSKSQLSPNKDLVVKPIITNPNLAVITKITKRTSNSESLIYDVTVVAGNKVGSDCYLYFELYYDGYPNSKVDTKDIKTQIYSYDLIESLYLNDQPAADTINKDVYTSYVDAAGLPLVFDVYPTTVHSDFRKLYITTNDYALDADGNLNPDSKIILLDQNGKKLTFTNFDDGSSAIVVDSGQKIFVLATSKYAGQKASINVESKFTQSFYQNGAVVDSGKKTTINFDLFESVRTVSFAGFKDEDKNKNTFYFTSNQNEVQTIYFDVAPANARVNQEYILVGENFEYIKNTLQVEKDLKDTDENVIGRRYSFDVKSIANNQTNTSELSINFENGRKIVASLISFVELNESKLNITLQSQSENSAVGKLKYILNSDGVVFEAAIKNGNSAKITINTFGADYTTEFKFADAQKDLQNYEKYFDTLLESNFFSTSSNIVNPTLLSEFDFVSGNAEGKTQIQIVLKGNKIVQETTDGIVYNRLDSEKTEITRYFYVEVYNPVKTFEVSEATVSLYSFESVGYYNKYLSQTSIELFVNKNQVEATYQDIKCTSGNLNGFADVSFDNQTNIATINAISTKDEFSGNYMDVYSDGYLKFEIEEFGTTHIINVKIIIKHAVMVESIDVFNVNLDNGIYLEIGKDANFNLDVEVSNSDAFNKNLIFTFVPDEGVASDIISIDKWTGKISVNGTQGGTGKIVITPQDCYSGESEPTLNANDQHVQSVQKIIPITIADGKSKATAKRITSLTEIQDNTLHYVLTQNCDAISLGDFSGGLYGDETNPITISFDNAQSLFDTFSGIFEDFVLTGNVSNAFVAKTNKGTIANITVDTSKTLSGDYTASVVDGNGKNSGGLVVENKGQILNCNFYGAIKNADTVGAICAINNGQISNCTVEFYKFSDCVGQIIGQVVGGLVGKMNSGKIFQSYVYNYHDQDCLTATTCGALAGQMDGGVIEQSFAKTNIAKFVGDEESVEQTTSAKNIKNCFVIVQDNTQQTLSSTIVNADKKYLKSYSLVTDSRPEGYNTFNSYFIANKISFTNNSLWAIEINTNDGYPYLKDVQAEQSNLLRDFNVQQTDQSLANGTNVILFVYEKQNMVSTTTAEDAQIAKWNTISFAKLFGLKSINGVRAELASASDKEFVTIYSNGIQLKKAGQFQLKVFSKYDYTNSKTFDILAINAIEDFKLVYKDAEVTSNSTISMKKSSVRKFNIQFVKEKVAVDRAIALKQCDLDIKFVDKDGHSINATQTANVISIDTSNFTQNTVEVNFIPSLQGVDAQFSDMISDNFGLKFNISLFNGADQIFVDVSNVIYVQPLDVVKFAVTTFTDNFDEELDFDIIDSNGMAGFTEDELYNGVFENSNADGFRPYTKQIYGLNDDNTWTEITESTGYEYFKIVYNVKLQIDQSYLNRPFEELDLTFNISSNLVKTVTTSVNIVYNSQMVERVFFSNFLFSKWDKATGYTFEEEPENVVNPGKSSLLTINLYPAFADYSYIEITSSVVDNEVLSLYPLVKQGSFYKRQTQDYFVIDNGIRLNNNYQTGDTLGLYNVLVVVPSNVNQDSVFEITVKAYNSKSTLLKTDTFVLVSRPLVASTITVDGDDTKLMARGTYADIVVTTQLDQKLDSIKISGQGNVSGITLDKIEESIDEAKNLKVYTTKVFVGENATFENQDDCTFEVVSTVSRSVGGIIEEKPSKVKISVVDFLINDICLDVDSANKNNMDVFLGIDKNLNFVFDTTTWEDTTSLDPATEEAIIKLKANVQTFLYQNYFVANDPDGSDSFYYVNYHDGDEEYNTNLARYKNMLNNLYYINNDGTTTKVLSASGYLNPNSLFDFEYAGNGKWSDVVGGKELKIIGKATGTQKMRLIFAYLTPDKIKHEITYDFTITIKVYTDEDRPTQINTAEEFVAIQNEQDAQDYILMNDIELTNFVPFDTDNIKTFDGNNKVISIRNFDLSDNNANAIKLALFDNVSSNSTLKNITVNYYHNDTNIIDITIYKDIKFAGFAISNDGNITNCHVLAFKTNASLPNPTGSIGLNLSYSTGSISSQIQSKTAGFVYENNGVITNSRVGGDNFTKILNNKISAGDYALSTFNISAQGDIAGFVYENNGIISSSFANNINITNNTKAGMETATAGFAVYNQSGTISLSYARGVYSKTNPNEIKTTGSSISTNGVGAGFVYKNTSSIYDCYSNIKLKDTANNSGRNSAGFVYNNAGTINKCYSSSIIENSLTTQMNFNGVDDYGQLLNTGTITNCYYYSPRELSDDDSIMDMDETYGAGVLRIENFDTSDVFYGFSFAPLNSLNGVWTMTASKGPELISANNIATSSRYVVQTGENEFVFAFVEGYNYGSDKNPILISNAQEFNQVFGNSTRSAVQQYYDAENKIAFGNYRLINNIDLSELATEEEDYVLISSQTSLTNEAVFDGNSLTISNLELTSNQANIEKGFGMFASILENSAVLNTNITVKNINASNMQNVGAVAGIVHNSTLANINIDSTRKGEISPILGQNVVGGIVGIMFGDSSIVSCTASGVEVSAEYFDENIQRQYYTRPDSKQSIDNSKLSYAGGVVGILDLYYTAQYAQSDYDKEQLVSASHSALLHSNGGTIVKGGTAGGVIGYSGQNNYVRDAQFIIEKPSTEYTSKIISYGYSAGGIIGENYGDLTQSAIEHDRTTQNKIESNVSLYYKGNDGYDHGYEGLFESAGTYNPTFVGGLVGQIFSGQITNSYSNANVIAENADYVGGLFGGIGDFYKQNSNKIGYNYFNELYAFGDVSSKDLDSGSKTVDITMNVKTGVAGGIAGFVQFAERTIEADGSKYVDIIIDGVNAVNFYSPYHKTTDNTTELIFENIFDFYGATYYNNATVLATDYDKNVGLFTLSSEEIDSEGEEPTYSPVPDSAVNYVIEKFEYQNVVYKPRQSVYARLFSGPKTFSEKIEPLSDVTTPDVDGGYMDVIFRNNHWSPYKWERNSEELLPRILFSTSSSIIYIRTAEDIKLMAKYPNKTFIIYGSGPDGDREVYVDCSEVDNTFVSAIQNFRGVLKGYKTDQNGQPLFGFSNLKNLTYALISSTQNGAVFSDFILSNCGNADSNTFVGSSILVENASGVIFRNLLLKECSIATTSTSAGLLAGNAVNCMFSNITIENTAKPDFVTQNIEGENGKTSYYAGTLVGMISGTRSTVIKDCIIKYSYGKSGGVQVIGLAESDKINSSAGGFVGGVVGGSLQFSSVQQFVDGTNGKNFTVQFSQQGNAQYTVNIGLIAGKTSSFSFSTENEFDIIGKLIATDTMVKELNIGGLTGSAEGFTTINSQFNSKIIIQVGNSSDTLTSQNSSSLNVGGLIGNVKAKTTISNIDVYFDIEEQGNIKIETNASCDHVGGLVGLAADGITCTNTKFDGDIIYIDNSSTGCLYYGGAIGYIQYQTRGSEGCFTIQNFTNTACVSINQTPTVYAGGIIGALNKLSSSTSSSIYDTKLLNNIVYEDVNIQRLINCKIYAGGIIGESCLENSENQMRRNILLEENYSLGEININSQTDIDRDNDKIYLGGLVASGNSNLVLNKNYSYTTLYTNRISSNYYYTSALVGNGDCNNKESKNNIYSDYNLSGILAKEAGIAMFSQNLGLDDLENLPKRLKETDNTWELGSKFNPYSVSDEKDELNNFLTESNGVHNTRIYLQLQNNIGITEPLDISNFAILGNGYNIEVDESGVFVKNIDSTSYISNLCLDIQTSFPTSEDYTSKATDKITAKGLYAPILENNGIIYGVIVKSEENQEGFDNIYVNAKTAAGLVGINTGVVSSVATYLKMTNTFDDYNIQSGEFALDVAITAGIVAQNYGDIYASFSAGKIIGDYSYVYAISHDILNPIYSSSINSNPIVSYCYTILDCTDVCKLFSDGGTIKSIKDDKSIKDGEKPPVYANVFDIGANATCFYDIYATGVEDSSGQKCVRYITSQTNGLDNTSQWQDENNCNNIGVWVFASDCNFGYPVRAGRTTYVSSKLESDEGKEIYKIPNIGLLQLYANKTYINLQLVQNLQVTDDMGYVNVVKYKESASSNSSNWQTVSISNITIDGNGYAISGIELRDTGSNAIFGIANGCTFKNLYITSGFVSLENTGDNVHAGVLVDTAEDSTFENITITGFDINLSGNITFGCVAASAKQCTVDGLDLANNIFANDSESTCIILGGIFGTVDSDTITNISNCDISNFMDANFVNTTSQCFEIVDANKSTLADSVIFSGYNKQGQTSIDISSTYSSADHMFLWELQNILKDSYNQSTINFFPTYKVGNLTFTNKNDQSVNLGDKHDIKGYLTEIFEDTTKKQFDEYKLSNQDNITRYFDANNDYTENDFGDTLKNEINKANIRSYVNRSISVDFSLKNLSSLSDKNNSSTVVVTVSYIPLEINVNLKLLWSEYSEGNDSELIITLDTNEQSKQTATFNISLSDFNDLLEAYTGKAISATDFNKIKGIASNASSYTDDVNSTDSLRWFLASKNLPYSSDDEVEEERKEKIVRFLFGHTVAVDTTKLPNITENTIKDKDTVKPDGGLGTTTSPYIVKTAEEAMYCLQNNKSFILANSVDLGNIALGGETGLFTITDDFSIYGNGNFIKYKSTGDNYLLDNTNLKTVNLYDVSFYNINYAGKDNAILNKNTATISNVKSFGIANQSQTIINDNDKHVVSGIIRENSGTNAAIYNCSNYKILIGTNGKDGDVASSFYGYDNDAYDFINGGSGKDGCDANILGGILGLDTDATCTGSIFGCYNQGVIVGGNGGDGSNGADGKDGIDAGHKDYNATSAATMGGNGGRGGNGGNASIIGGIVAWSNRTNTLNVSGENFGHLYSGYGGDAGNGGNGGKGGDGYGNFLDIAKTFVSLGDKIVYMAQNLGLLLNGHEGSFAPGAPGGGGGAGGTGGSAVVGSLVGIANMTSATNYADNNDNMITLETDCQGAGGQGGKGGDGGEKAAFLSKDEDGTDYVCVIGGAGGGAGGNGWNGNDTSTLLWLINGSKPKATSGSRGGYYNPLDKKYNDEVDYGRIYDYKGNGGFGSDGYGVGNSRSDNSRWDINAMMGLANACVPLTTLTGAVGLSMYFGLTERVHDLYDDIKSECASPLGGTRENVVGKTEISKEDVGYQSEVTLDIVNKVCTVNSIEELRFANDRSDVTSIKLANDITLDSNIQLKKTLDGNDKTITIGTEDSPYNTDSCVFYIKDSSDSIKITNTKFALNIKTSGESAFYTAEQFIVNDVNYLGDDCTISSYTITVDMTYQEYILKHEFTDSQVGILKNEKWNFEDGLLGAGTESNPYLIHNAVEFKTFQKYANLGSSAYFKLELEEDLTLNADNATVTGDYNYLLRNFKGTLDGNGKTINFGATTDGRYLSGFVYENKGTLKNLTLTGTSSQTMVAYTNGKGGKIDSITVSGTIENPNGNACGIAISNYGTISNVENYATIVSKHADSNPSEIYNTDDIYLAYGYDAAGIAIINGGTIENSVNKGNVTASDAKTCAFDQYDSEGNFTTSAPNGGNAAGIAIYNIDISSISYETDENGNKTEKYGTATTKGIITNCQNEGVITAGKGADVTYENGIAGNGGSVGDICINYQVQKDESTVVDNWGTINIGKGSGESNTFGKGYYSIDAENKVKDIYLVHGKGGTASGSGGTNGSDGFVWLAVSTGELEKQTIVTKGDTISTPES